ncbi:HD domain-containing protein [Nocardioides immobilis]|uniref:HD domain-containing protein n=1 Tax=Nocardioides immobilis TaxID=2049295 RepID=A0A417XZU5_9ACTN|nr:HD domain-containing protein [Nocardioides immobilis]RHW25893.1 HD domain-containing protein [Nocardioides immobilis]
MGWRSVDCRSLAQELIGDQVARWRHVQAVANAAKRLSTAPSDDIVVSAAWLHDIGYSDKLVATGMHAIDGAAFLDLLGAPQELVSLVAFHTGAEHEADERGLLDRLIQFDSPPQDHLDALILADLISGPDGQPMTVAERLADMLRRYEPQHPVHRAVVRSADYLREAAARAAKRYDYPM